MFICRNFILYVFINILQRYCKLLILDTLGMYGYANPNDKINLQKTLMSICMPKLNFIIHFFLGILHFKESCNLIGFARQWIGGELSITIFLIFQRIQRVFWAILSPFYPNFGKYEFSWKKGLCQFLNILII